MRKLAPTALILSLAGAAWASGEPGVARLGGAYFQLETETSAACARACEDDTLCMAWTFRAGACSLTAIAPASTADAAAVSGFSSRVPAGLRTTLIAPIAAPAQSQPAPPAAAMPAPVPAEPEDYASQLLGGPDEGPPAGGRLAIRW